MRSVESAFVFLQDLEDYYKESDDLEPTQKSLGVAFFDEPVDSQEHFAQLYWDFAQLLHDIVIQRNEWDQSVASDPRDPQFELSLGGRAVFTTTLNPRNPRIARKFSHPVWILNQLSQFNHLRAIGRFSGWQKSIRTTDAEIDPSGESNPILVDHGQASAALQLAGSAYPEMSFKVRTTRLERCLALESLIERARAEGAPEDIIGALSNFTDVV